MPSGHASLTTRARCLLAAGLATGLCALVLDERDLLRVAAFVVVLPLLAALVVGRFQVGLRGSRKFMPSRLPVGAHCEAELAVRTGSRLGGEVVLEEEVPTVLGDAPRFTVPRVPRGSTVRLHYQLRPRLRGVHQVGPLVARVGDPFGLVEYRRELAACSSLVVTPVVVTLTGRPAGGGLDTGDDGAGPHHGGAGEDAVVVRSYRQGDDLRRVHWRSSARRDELMVRVEERPWQGGSTVLLDHRAAAHRGSGPTSSLEYAISMAASICVHLRRHGRRVRLVTADQVLPGDGAPTGHSTDRLLDTLAALHPTVQSELPSDPALAAGRELVAVLGASTPAAIERMLRLRTRGRHSHAVLLDVAEWGAQASGAVPPTPTAAPAAPAETARILLAAGWSVAVARPHQSIAAVWEQLCISSRGDREVLR